MILMCLFLQTAIRSGSDR